MASLPIDSWKRFFAGSEISTRYNQAGPRLLEMTATARSTEECIATLTQNPMAPILFINNLNNVQILMGTKQFGGDFFTPTFYGAVIPYGASSTPIEINLHEALTTIIEFAGPATATLKAVNSTASLEALQATTRNATQVKTRALFVIPPFVAAKLIDRESSTSTSNAFLIMNASLIEHDAQHDGSTLHESFSPVLRLLWANSQHLLNQVEAAKTPFAPTSTQLVLDWASELSAKNLQPNQAVTSQNELMVSAATNVAASVTNLQHELHGYRSDKVSARPKEKGAFKTWNMTSQRMVLFASSTDGQEVPTEPTEFLQNLCKIQSVTETQNVLTHTLESEHNCIVQISPGLAQALQKGIWLYTVQNIPSNMTIFALSRPTGSVEQAAMDLALQMKYENPMLLNDSDLKKLTHQLNTIAQNVPELEASYSNAAGLLYSLLGQYAMPTTYATAWANHVHKNYMLYVNQAARDILFLRKCQYAFDIRLQGFLRSCMTAKTREDVQDSYLGLDVLQQIALQNFSVDLPTVLLPNPSTTSISRGSSGTHQREEGAETNGQEKRSRTTAKTDYGPVVVNGSQNSAWDMNRQNMTWKNFHNKDKPIPNNNCLKWHIKGSCNQNCPRKASHKMLTGDERVSFQKWFDSCK
jgi:hypothetical protein